jgi:hypothetical protein
VAVVATSRRLEETDMDSDVDDLDEVFSFGTLGAGLAIVTIAVSTAFFEGPRDILRSSHAEPIAKVSTAAMPRTTRAFCSGRTDHRLLAKLAK